MNERLTELLHCIEHGKVDKSSPFPPDMQGQDGADEIAKKALEEQCKATEILEICSEGMKRIGDKFGRGEAFVPELLMSAKAMKAVMVHLKPFFSSGDVKTKGTFILGTVAGDLHDIGKNLVSMMVEGAGWKVLDLGIDVKPIKFLDAIAANPESVVGLSALLTTTMANMERTIKEIKTQYPATKVIVGGAPVSEASAKSMGADAYGSNASHAAEVLSSFAGA